MVNHNRPHANVRPFANAARASNVGTRLNGNVITDLGVMADERSAIDDDMTTKTRVRGENGADADDRSFAYSSLC